MKCLQIIEMGISVPRAESQQIRRAQLDQGFFPFRRKPIESDLWMTAKLEVSPVPAHSHRRMIPRTT